MAYSKTLFSVPNMLCYYRVAVIPVIMILLVFDGPWAAWTNVVLFTLAGVSDFLDGVIARAMKQTSLLGKFLDSSSDKILVGTMLMVLLAFDRIEGFWMIPAIIIFLREILISGVREFMAHYSVVVPVSRLSKWKTTTQLVFMGFLLAGPYGEMLIPHAYLIGKVGLVFAAIITVISGWDYVREALRVIQKMDAEASGTP